MPLVRGISSLWGWGYPRGKYVLILAQNSSSYKLSGNIKCEHPTRVGKGGGGGRKWARREDMELIIVFMQAANNTVQFPSGICTCALFISWFCYVRNVEVGGKNQIKATEEEKHTNT
jgi:hypothetical protein